MRRFPVRWILVGLVVALSVAAVAYWNTIRLPERVNACGRTFGHEDGAVGAGPFTLNETKKHEPEVQLLRDLPRGRELWASPGCGLGVFVRVSDGEFLGYGLLGGP